MVKANNANKEGIKVNMGLLGGQSTDRMKHQNDYHTSLKVFNKILERNKGF